MQLFYETGPKPSYVEISEDDVLKYAFYFCPRYYPSYFSMPSNDLSGSFIANYTLEIISGEDPFLQRVAIILEFFNYEELFFIYGNVENTTASQLFEISITNNKIFANNTDWTILCEKLNNKYYYNFDFTALPNGYIMEYNYEGMYFKNELIYFPNGTAQYINSYNKEGNLYMTWRYNEFDYKMYCPPIDDDNDDDEKEVESAIPGADIVIIQISIIISILGLIWYYRKKI
jgi:hypothetical protein